MAYSVGGVLITNPAGSERIAADNGAGMNAVITVATITAFGNPDVYTNSQTASATLTALQMVGNPPNTGVVAPFGQCFMFCNGSLGGGVTFTTPTVAQMIAQFTQWIVGTSYEFDIINAGTGQTVTLGAGTGVTISGTAGVSNNTWRKFVVTLTSATAITITMLEVGTYS